ncbi:MAG: Mth938-like domain-containing protein [Gemmatimonadota bacterium]
MAHDRSGPNISPRIRRVAWGRIEVEGAGAIYKDAKLWPGGSREWDWNETGTRHEPGIQPADVQELLVHGATTIVLSRGVQRRLRVHPDTLEMLEEKGVTAHVLQTEEAVRLYNELRKGEAVGGLFHSTC